MAVSFVAEAHADMAAGSVTVNVPSGTQDGDVMIAFISSTSTPAAHGTGWSDVIITQPRAGEDFGVFYRVASSEPASYTWSWGAGGGVGAIVTYRDVDFVAPIDVTGAAGTAETSGTTITAPTITTLSAQALLVTAYSIRTASTFSTPTDMTERLDYTDGAAAIALAIDDQIIAAAGATGTRATTTSATINWGRGVSLSLRINRTIQPTAALAMTIVPQTATINKGPQPIVLSGSYVPAIAKTAG